MRILALLLLGLGLGARVAQGAVLLPGTALWSWRLADAEPDTAGIWRELDYEGLTDGWSQDPAPFRRALDGSGTLVPNQAGGFLARTTWVILNPDQYSAYRFSGSVAGGVVLWLNGVEIWRDRVPTGEESPDSRPMPGSSEVRSLAVVLDRWDLASLRPGSNVLSVLILPEGATTPLRWVLGLDADPDIQPPVSLRILPPPGSQVSDLNEVEILFSEPVRGVDAGDLLVNGVPAAAVTPLGPDHYSFSLPAVGQAEVRVEWRPDAGVTDRSTPPNPFVAEAWAYRVEDIVPPDAVQISEFMADNDRTFRDENGDDVDWIELHNPSLRDVRLVGWGLTDDRDRPFKWTFPDVVLPARAFLLVYASEKNRTNVPGRLHTNFKLDAGGEYLGLTDASGQGVSSFAPRYPNQSRDVSFGRANGAPEIVGYFEKPTPGAANSQSGGAFAPAVAMDRPSGTYSGTITVRLSLVETDPNAVIRFTTNNTLPVATSPVYTAPVTFSTAVVVRARAFSPGRLPGPPSSANYIPLSTGAAQFRSDLPVLLLHDYGRGRPSTVGVPGTVQLFEPVNGVTSMTNPPTLAARVQLASRGSSTEGLTKVSLKVEFRDEFELDRDVAWLGMPEDSDWVLYAPNVFDPIMTHNPFIHGLANDLGYYASRTRFVEVYLVQTGMGAVQTTSYNGIYVLEEKVKRGKDRVDVDKLEPEHALEPEVTGGYLFKVDRPDPGDTGFGVSGVTMMYVEPKEPEIERPERAAQRAYVGRFFSQFASALNGASYRNPTTGYARYLDVDQSIDFHLLNTVAFNVDGLVLSTFLHKPREGKLTFGPLWDFDRALGSTDGRDANPRTWGANFFTAYWWPRLFSDPDFTQRWIDRYQGLRLGQLSRSNTHARLDRLTGQLRQAQPRERAKWGTTYRGGTYASEIVYSKNWLSNRLDFMDSRFVPRIRDASPIRDPLSGKVRLMLIPPTNANVVVLYTTNGTDPRMTGGAVSSSAFQYSAAVPLEFDSNVRVIARAYSLVARTGTPNSRWGCALMSAVVVRRPVLRFTEVHYHPPGEGTAEFLEVLNPGKDLVSLDGWQLSGGIQFRFAGSNRLDRLEPGQRCIVVADTNAFLSPPAGMLIAGQYEGRLANSSDFVDLLGPVGEVVDSIRYLDETEPLADGGGWSLVPRSEASLDETQWRLSAAVGGSPGTPDLASLAGPGGDTDADGLPDVWELRFGLIVGEAASDRGGDDRDADGVNNFGEFLAGTNPVAAASVMTLSAEVVAAGQIRLRWTRLPGRAVRVLVSESPGERFRVLVDVPARGTADEEEVADAIGSGERYYRLSVP